MSGRFANEGRTTGYPVSAEGQRMQKKFWDELSIKLDQIAPGATANVKA